MRTKLDANPPANNFLAIMAFADRSCAMSQDVQEIFRFSYMLFLSVRAIRKRGALPHPP